MATAEGRLAGEIAEEFLRKAIYAQEELSGLGARDAALVSIAASIFAFVNAYGLDSEPWEFHNGKVA